MIVEHLGCEVPHDLRLSLARKSQIPEGGSVQQMDVSASSGPGWSPNLSRLDRTWRRKQIASLAQKPRWKEVSNSGPRLGSKFPQLGGPCTPKHAAIVNNKCFTLDIMTVRFVVQVLIAGKLVRSCRRSSAVPKSSRTRSIICRQQPRSSSLCRAEEPHCSLSFVLW